MIRNGFVGIAGAVVVAAIVAQTSLGAQGSAAPKTPSTPGTSQKAAPPPPPPPEKAAPAKAATSEKATQEKAAPAKSGGVVPATTPTQQPATGAAEEPKVAAAALMSVHIPKKVLADGKLLAAGNYMLRVTNDSPSKVVGQTASEQRWVEFVQGGQVKGREVATVLTTGEAKTIAKQGLPASGSAKVETLVGNDYLRVWINKSGTNYLVYLNNQGT